ncbi:S-layer family protein [Oculatella sp. LEGE 06141]|uniref:beta strand repeat-containing protein n=1 Tax=Oculatella sp. LEGE 06141 TaxID=1828648 RepID=UPI001882F6A5|nr:S-layer family protein [Oculatella sp. LEGE 06141]MBE9181159.1 S-layer family protein [Oculatella sp. LEGE 06141]
MYKGFSWVFTTVFTVVACLTAQVGRTQVTPDGSLSTAVTSVDGRNFTIDAGDRAGRNLFHSFRDFSVPRGGSALFNNAPDVQNIFGRVTGGNVSSIDGLIRANGSANLFLLNPSGILFGPNASLNVGGSFVGTTANQVRFADGTAFQTSNSMPSPLLSMSAPVGLQLGANAGAIHVQGTPAENFLFRNFFGTSQVFQAESVALVASKIDVNESTLSVPDGRVELWAVRNAEVAMNNQTGWQLASPAAAADWGTITLRQASLIDTTGVFFSAGTNGGAINIRARGLTLKGGSGISSGTGANGQGPGITVQTTEFVNLLGISSPENYATPGIFTSAFGSGARAGDITIETEQLRIANGGWLQSIINFGFDPITFMPAPINDSTSGNITVRASDVEVRGYNPFPISGFQSSSITTVITAGSRNESGSINIEADRVRLLNGGRITSDLLGFSFPGFGQFITTGTAGDISIRATDRLEISGVTPGGVTGAISSSIQPFAEGRGGNISIDTGRLRLFNGGTISSSLSGRGEAGNIDIRARDVAVSDPVIDSVSQRVSGITTAVGEGAVGQGGTVALNADRLHVFNGGQITSSTAGDGSAGNVNLRVNTIDVQGISRPLSDGRQLPSTITASSTTAADAGSVNITSDSLRVRDGATVSVSNTGAGNAGNLRVTANRIQLDNRGSLQAEVSAGDQGNILLDVADAVVLRRGSRITANASGDSTGGNIAINTHFIVAVSDENSDITANAENSFGGRVSIDATGIFGTEFRSQLTPMSDITASSGLGAAYSGTVTISNPDVDPGSDLVQLPENVVDASNQVATGCGDSANSRFVATGRGGIPLNPNEQVSSDRPWSDVRDISGFVNADQNHATITAPSPATTAQITEINSWVRNVNGQVELVATSLAQAQTVASVTCSVVSEH